MEQNKLLYYEDCRKKNLEDMKTCCTSSSLLKVLTDVLSVKTKIQAFGRGLMEFNGSKFKKFPGTRYGDTVKQSEPNTCRKKKAFQVSPL
ncbi:hypothetical protein GWI33_020579 [Rhynchophorus ferrugineus]|uniref:Uncharacterized protein n=1 Tax=Rhynchophorus ferrugineus TaxID=354439 RepID=A0A834HQP7_RHYFE|nr:hypothetical protein GWI33_020579 [Rhynchophorus ferrugineus]